MSEDEIVIPQTPKPPIVPAVIALVLFSAAYGIGHLTLTAPMPVGLETTPEEEVEQEEQDLGPPPRRYVSFPVSLSANVPKWGTLLLDIGMAVHQELPEAVTDTFLEDSARFSAPLSQAMLEAVEDPDAKALEDLQRIMLPLLRDAMNEVISSDKLPDPVLEIYILKLISTGS
jgi:hypothetical protein